MPLTVRFKRVDPRAVVPNRATPGAVGYDLCALDRVEILPGWSAVIHTGIALELPPGYEGQVRPRSSMSRCCIVVPVGTIDSDYRGVIGATLINCSDAVYVVEAGHRVAQLVIARVELPEFVEADDLEQTARGAGGFGSTGR